MYTGTVGTAAAARINLYYELLGGGSFVHLWCWNPQGKSSHYNYGRYYCDIVMTINDLLFALVWDGIAVLGHLEFVEGLVRFL